MELKGILKSKFDQVVFLDQGMLKDSTWLALRNLKFLSAKLMNFSTFSVWFLEYLHI